MTQPECQASSPRATPSDRLLVGLFLATITLPLFVLGIGEEQTVSKTENRQLAPRPDLPRTRSAIRGFPQAFDKYFADHFGFRQQLIRAHRRYELALAGRPPQVLVNALATTPQAAQTNRVPVITGNDDWLFFADRDALASCRSDDPFKTVDLERWRRTLEDRQAWLAARGIDYVFVLVPNKHTVYNEQLPRGVRRVGRRTRMDQLVDYLGKHSSVPVVDLRPALAEARRRERIYHKTDTHWNHLGAYAGYRALMRALPEWCAAASIWQRDDFRRTTTNAPGGDLAGMMALAEQLREDYQQLVPQKPRRSSLEQPLQPGGTSRSRGPADLPRAVVLHDSFFTALAPFVSEHFSHVEYFWTYEFAPEQIAAQRPELVVQEMVERFLYSHLPRNPDTLPAARVDRIATRPTGR